MATKSYSKHKEYKEFKSSGNVPYTDEQFDMLKGELLPKSKLDSLGKSGAGAREYHYEYKEEKHPSGKYDRKDLRTVEEYTIPPKTVPKNKESSSYYYEREERELPSINKASAMKTYHYDSSTSSTPGYSKVKQTTVKKDLAHNVEELDSLLDDLQKDQERQLYKSGYTSDTAESTSFDYKRGTPIKAPSSGYSTLKKEERVETSSWGSSPPPPVASTLTRAEQQIYREETHESRVVPSQVSPAIAQPVPAPVCGHCHHVSERTGTLTRSSTPMNKVTTTVKTYTYEVPADQDPTTVPIPVTSETSERYLSEQRVTSSSSGNQLVPPSPSLGCQYCAHCNSSVTTRREILPATTSHTYHHVSTDDRTNERTVNAPAPAPAARPTEPYTNGHGPYSPTQYKYTETSYSAQNTTERYPPAPPAPPAGGSFPRPLTPSPGDQQPPKRLDDLLADFPEARFPTQPDGVSRRVHVTHERSSHQDQRALTPAAKPPPPVGSSRNVAGPAVYYPPGHTPFEKKEVQPSAAYQASASQGGGAYASGRGMYEYESGSKSKEKHTEKKTAVPICLPLCCAMPCVIM